MREYILRRVLLMIPVLLLVTVFVFVAMRILPGDVAALIAESQHAEDIEQVEKSLGLDRPLVVQYFTWLGGLVRGDLGESFWTGQPVAQEIRRAFPVSFELALMTVLVSAFVSIVVGVIAAVYQDTWVDYVLRSAAILGLTLPTFWVGIMLLVALGKYFHWVPPVGYVSFFEDPSKNIQQFIFPALVQGLALGGFTTRMMRSQTLEVLRQDYIRTARAKGLKGLVVVHRHVVKNALIPVVTMFGLQLVFLLGGQVLIEQIFSLPGLGRLVLNSVLQRDYPLLQGLVVFIALTILTMNLAIDLMYSWLDPRIRYG